MLIKIFEKIAVETIEAPLNIIHIELSTKLKPMYPNIDWIESKNAGMKNIQKLCGFFPYSRGT
jgi:hypothetical protein